MLDLLEGPLDGKAWEKLCNSCYRMRYQDQHFIEIPAIHGGDGGIEGYTQSGVVYQCYCPEREYSDTELYNHLREKMTKDINKLINLKYAKRLADFGVPQIKEWHFVIPEYKDHRILKHAEGKKQDVLLKRQEDISKYDYIHADFIIVIKTASDFKVEISKLIRTSLTDVKLNFAIQHTSVPDWSKCPSDKVNNIKRKVRVVMGNVDESDEDYISVVNTYIQSYIKGLEILNKLRVDYSEIYEDIHQLVQSYRREVSLRTKMNTDSSINSKLFNEILNEFQTKLENEFKYLNLASISELKIDIVSGWLADCSMQFKAGETNEK